MNSSRCDGAPEVIHQRETFYIGGQYVEDKHGNHTIQGQMYVEHLSPQPTVHVKSLPMIFIHGATRTGNDWLSKPDGNPGWASYFLARGYEVFLVDLPYRGRSPWAPEIGTVLSFPVEMVEKKFTACEKYILWPQAKLHTQWPGTGVRGDPIFDKFYASGVQMLASPLHQELASQAACAALLDRIQKPVVLISHSAGGSIPWLVADIRPNLVKMIVALEPIGPPFYQAAVRKSQHAPYGLSWAPITYDPPVADPMVDLVKTTVRSTSPTYIDWTLQAEAPTPRKLIHLTHIPTLVVTAQASYHAQYDDGMVAFLKQAGIPAKHLRLEEKGICGNGHMMFMEKNSDDIAAEIEQWMDETVTKAEEV